MRNRGRRRSQGTWFPTIGTVLAGDPERVLAGRMFSLTGLAGTNINTLVFPLTYDVPQFKDSTVTSDKGLGEIVNNEYVVKRIVGKWLIHRVPVRDVGVEVGSPILVTAGFFVARAGDGAAQDAPIGAAANTRDEYSPLDMDNIREPWMFRRTWILGNEFLPQGVTFLSEGRGMPFYPGSTAGYGSVLDGPHFDVKSRRRVSSDDRLWAAVSVAPYPAGSSFGSAPLEEIEGYLDYRIFGQLRRPRQSGSF